MDSSSSTTSMSVLANWDASPSVVSDDDGAVSVTAGLAKEAALHFQSGRFGECVKVLNQLRQKKENDPKVLHNIAIVENFQDGCIDPRRLLVVLNNVKKQSEELARASGEYAEIVGNLGNKGGLGTKATNSSAQLSMSNNSPIVFADGVDTSVAVFNMGVTWYHLHEYAKSFSVLEPLYQIIEPIDEGTALRICLLLLDVALLSCHASRSADVISYLERVFCLNSLALQNENGSTKQQPSSNPITKAASVPSNSAVRDASNSDSVASPNASESSLERTLSDETLEYETLLSSLDASGQNSPNKPSGFQSSNEFLNTQADESILTIDLRLKLHLYKVQFLLLTRNLNAAKREVKLAMNSARGKDYSLALLLKSQLEYARGNHCKAIKLLMASSKGTEMGSSSIYYSNLGCIYYHLGKHQTSTIFFSKALNNSASLRKEKPKKLSTFSQDKSLLIIYNCGVLYLTIGKPVLAAHCFYKSSIIFYNRPLLWLRIAECCLMALDRGLLKSSPVPSDKSKVKVHVVGKGKWRQLVLEDGNLRNGQMDFIEREVLFPGDEKQPNLSMSVARQCLFNALHLLNSSESKYSFGVPSNLPLEEIESQERVLLGRTKYKSVSVGDFKASGSGQVNTNGELKEQKGGNHFSASLHSSISEYECICRKENQIIKQALYADLAFVELELGNPLKALSAAQSLLKLQECSRIYIFLGNVYAAEALCLLNRPKEAAEHLLVYVSGENVELPYSQDDWELCQVEKNMDCEEPNGGSSHTFSSDESQGVVFLKPEEARGTLYANMAVMCAMQGDLEQAHQYVVQALSAIPNSLEAILTAIYVDLMCGKMREALAKLKQCSCIRFLPGSLMLNGSS